MTLTLAVEVAGTDNDVTVAYAKPDTGTDSKLVDGIGKEVDSFTAQDVTNLLDDPDPPTLVASDPVVVDADGITVTLQFNETMKAAPLPDAAAFTVKATTATGAVDTIALAFSNQVAFAVDPVTLKLATPAAEDEAVTVTYTKPGTGAVLEDPAGNDAPDFSDHSTVNNSVKPRIRIGALYVESTRPLISNLGKL